jgi:hypothetical protein
VHGVGQEARGEVEPRDDVRERENQREQNAGGERRDENGGWRHRNLATLRYLIRDHHPTEVHRVVAFGWGDEAFRRRRSSSSSSLMLSRFSTDMIPGRKAVPRQVAVLSEGSLRRWRRLKRLEELPCHDQMAVLKMIDALADRSAKRKSG